MASLRDGVVAVRKAPLAAIYVFAGQLVVFGLVWLMLLLLPFAAALVGLLPSELAVGVEVRSLGPILFVVCYFSAWTVVAMLGWTWFKGAAVHAMATALRGGEERTTVALARRWKPLLNWGGVAALGSAVVARFLPPVAYLVRRLVIDGDRSSDGRSGRFVLPAIVLGDAATIDEALDESDRRSEQAGGFPPVSVIGICLTFVLVMVVWTGTLSFAVASDAVDRMDPLVFQAAFYGAGATLFVGIAGTFLLRTAVRTHQYVEADDPDDSTSGSSDGDSTSGIPEGNWS